MRFTRTAAALSALALVGCGCDAPSRSGAHDGHDGSARPNPPSAPPAGESDPCRFQGELLPTFPDAAPHTEADADWLRTMVIGHHGQVLEVCDIFHKERDDASALKSLTPEQRQVFFEVRQAFSQWAESQHVEMGWAEQALTAWGEPLTGGHSGAHMPGHISDKTLQELRTADPLSALRIALEAMQAHHEGMLVSIEGLHPDAHFIVGNIAEEAKAAQGREIKQMDRWLARLEDRGPATPGPTRHHSQGQGQGISFRAAPERPPAPPQPVAREQGKLPATTGAR